jgi:hypothetical protein
MLVDGVTLGGYMGNPNAKENYAKIKAEAERQIEERGYILMAELLLAKATTRQNIQQIIMPKLERDLNLERVNRYAWRVIGGGVEVPDQTDISKYLKKTESPVDKYIEEVREIILEPYEFRRIDLQNRIKGMSSNAANKIIEELLQSGEILAAEARRNWSGESNYFIHTVHWNKSIAGRIPRPEDTTDMARMRKLLLSYKESGEGFYGLQIADALNVNAGLANLELGRLADCEEIICISSIRMNRGAPRKVYKFKKNFQGEEHA